MTEYWERFYKDPDPWGFQDNADDALRLKKILAVLKKHSPFKRALDVGAGEGWITHQLPADEIHAIEISNAAASRFPENVKRVYAPDGKYDLVVATGVLYDQYDRAQMEEWIKEAASKIVLIAGMDDELVDDGFGKLLSEETFDYRERKQILRVYSLAPQRRVTKARSVHRKK